MQNLFLNVLNGLKNVCILRSVLRNSNEDDNNNS